MLVKKVLTIYLGRNSPRDITVKQDGVPVPFVSLGATSLAVELDGTEYSSNDGYVAFDNNGVVTLTLGSLTNISKGKRNARLIMYSDTYKRGKVLLSEKTEYRLVLDFV
ncbi:hypothetical protein J7384_17050 [Endozoicomonas sp. G2_1]|uniref:hypothetical protein n=1 Tax=Endozoicomonas sp. G2_1 TaxID=2821091 RepID=UPI001ADA6416|nr:hypothetical protein [Endozoicomonas sp. G2_1]MBO9492072.1 hypothetical protein [Endozoicomonas sp. G2_1]